MSENYQVTARKWRSQRFDEVVGQDHVTRTLKNAIREGRLAHAYLFTGQRGCGKTTVARLLAKAINCPNAEANGYEPCNACEICTSITNGSSMDVAEIDGASNNGVDDVRSMRENVKYPPLQGKYRVIIIDEVHMLSASAFNALLKTLEEPPRHLIFVFATTEAQKLPATILSRTQRYDFRRIQIEEIVSHLKHIAQTDGISIDDDALLLIAKKADGSMRDAQSIYDQAIAYCGTTVETSRLREALNLIDADFYFEVSDAIREQATNKAFSLAFEVVSRGYDIEEFLQGLLEHFRNFLTIVVTGKKELLEVVKYHQERYAADAKGFTESDILRLVRLGFNALERLKSSQSHRIVLELALVEMTMMERSIEITSLLEELKGLKGGANPLPASGIGIRSSAMGAAQANSEPGIPKPAIRASAPRPATEVASGVQPETRSPKPEIPSERSHDSTPIPDAASRWGEFLDFVSAKSIPFRLVCEDIEHVGSSGAMIVIGVSKKHTEETFARNKDLFTKFLREFFAHDSLTYEMKRVEKKSAPAVISAAAPAPRSNGLNQSPAVQAVTIDDNVERSGLEIALIQEMGAIPI
ncbi:MAG: DNA polymerase III subunit gamma/tau [Bacteroidota bacterium]|nr:DNA polymerase III subunit gamma/tau [Bacteroidota bacterium]